MLANIYLNPLDHLMAENGCEMVRYADDCSGSLRDRSCRRCAPRNVILCRSRAAAEAALARVQTWVAENGLKLHPEKTRIVDATQRGGLWIHGGGWTGGQKTAAREKAVCLALAADGYVCASIDYKLGTGAWPQNLFDGKNAVRFLRARAGEFPPGARLDGAPTKYAHA
ncbi:MAG: reverse transcriptase domain-containing protein [Opitutaceae bacterium]